MAGEWRQFWEHVRAGFNLPKRAFDDCEGCYARPATRWTADDVYLCEACYKAIPPQTARQPNDKA